jgi:8-oxo-dGTP pyrophosphatase MutT (NUDIX family)
MDTHRPLLRLLKNYTACDAAEAAAVANLEQFLATTANAYSRSNQAGHVVADAWIVNPARSHVVLVEHKLSGAWLAPGGHCDGDPDVHAAARREAAEETGLTGLKPLLGGAIYDVNRGTIPDRHTRHGFEPAHTHFDLCFAFEAQADAPLNISDESTQLAWIALDNIPATYWPEHRRRVQKTPFLPREPL